MINNVGAPIAAKIQSMRQPGGVRSASEAPNSLPNSAGTALTSVSSIEEFTQKVMAGVQFTSRELLLYQIRVGEFNLKVELVAKCAEAFNASLRKLQQGQ